MKFTELAVAGAFLVEGNVHRDERGAFSRLFCADSFAARGLEASFPQVSLSRNHARGTFRGMHWQVPPHAEAKLVRCMAGRLTDIVLDLRAGSPSRGRWAAVELDAAAEAMVYIPRGCAHGFLTRADDTQVLYFISAAYAPAAARGVRWDDPAFDIRLPEAIRVMAEKDGAHPPWSGDWL